MKYLITTLLLMSGLAFGSTVDISSGLVGYFPINGNADDASGNGRNAVVYNSANTLPDTNRFGVPSSAYRFDLPANGFDPVLWGTGINLAGRSLTIAFWTYGQFTQSLDDYTGIGVGTVQPGTNPPLDPNPAGKYLSIYASWERIRFSFYGNNLDVSSGSLLQDWNHLAFTYDATSGSRNIFLNSQNIASDIALYGFAGTDLFTMQGRNGTKIDDVRFYDRALSSGEVNAVYLVPEPSSLSLLLAGGLVALAGRRKA